MDNQPSRKTTLNIRANDEVLKGSYANLMRMSSTKEEFILDFASVNPSDGSGVLVSRVFIHPSHAKRMISVLQHMMQQYEDNHGAVAAADEHSKEIGFHTPA